MNKLILTFEILNEVDRQVAFNHGVALASKALEVHDNAIVNPLVGIEIKTERASAAVQVGYQAPRLICKNTMAWGPRPVCQTLAGLTK